MNQTDLSTYIHSAAHRKDSWLKRILWFYLNALIFKTSWLPFSDLKVQLLRLFGAKVGKAVIIKPGVNIKHPWLLHIGNHTWIGENVWIDNLVNIYIGHHVCISQGALLLTGSHNYKDPAFGLITGSIILEDGVWIGARAVVNHSIRAESHAVLSAAAVATKNLEGWSVYQGNPAVKVRARNMSSAII
uniref:WcaF family extracellular polysaccharide biosynthesis acetyltransferase n=1 Tax=Pedobacter schmidteae TaxID=2201271 RepID=UPI000EB05E9F|nr:WcaF family extracellular polysaccharide biosynthesis acetyltransferase [Pedobacter schmidteae]